MPVKKDDLRTYKDASHGELARVRDELRQEIDSPKLSFQQHLNNLAYSSIVVGVTVAPVVTGLAAYAAIKSPKLRKMLGVEYNSFKDVTKALEPYLEKNPLGGIYQFAWETFKWPTIASFVLPTTVSYVTLNEIGKKDKASENAANLSHAERVLSERDSQSASLSAQR